MDLAMVCVEVLIVVSPGLFDKNLDTPWKLQSPCQIIFYYVLQIVTYAHVSLTVFF